MGVVSRAFTGQLSMHVGGGGVNKKDLQFNLQTAQYLLYVLYTKINYPFLSEIYSM